MTAHRVPGPGNLSAPACFTLVIVLAFWKAIFSPEFTLLSGGDLSTQIYPWFNVASYWLKRGTLLLWDPYVYSGKASLAELQPGTLYPLYWVFRLFPANAQGMNLVGLQSFVLFHHFLAAYFTFLLGRSLGLRPAGAALAGIAFALCGYVAFLYNTANIFSAAAWMPLFFLLFRRAARARDGTRWRLLFWSALVLALSILPGHHAPAVHMGLLALFFTLFTLLGEWKTTRAGQKLSCLMNLALVAGIAVLLDAVQLLPSAEWARNVWRWVGEPEPVGWGQPVSYSVLERTINLHPQDLASLLVPHMSTSETLYFGAPVTFLALTGLLFGRGREAQFFGLAAFLFLFISFGRFSAFHGWIYTFVPGIWFARETYLYLVPFSLCFALLAGYGLDSLLQSYGAAHQGVLGVFVRRAGWGMAWLVLCCWVLVVAARTLKELPMTHPYLTAAADLSIYLAILGALLFALQVGKIGASVFGVLVVGLTLLDLASHVSVRIPRVEAAPGQKSPAVEKVWAMPRAAHYLRSLRQKEVFRVSDYSEGFPPNFGDGWRIEETMGSSATALVRYFAFRGIGWGPGSNASALLNARYFVSRTPVPGMPKVFEDGDAVYRNPRAVPRAFVAERYRVMAGDEEILDWIRSPLFSPGETVILKEEDLNALPAAFLREASRESAGMRVRPLGYTTAAEREREKTNDTELQNLLTVFQAPWGWSNGDDLELSFAPESPLPECYLIVTYYPSASGVSRLPIRVDGASGSTTFSVELPGLESGLPPDLPARAVAKLGPLGAGEFRLRLAKTEACSAYLDSVRVTAALPPAEEQNPGTVAVTSFAPNRIKLAASLTRPAFVVLSEVYYPGWEATVDGRPAPLVNGDYILRAVPVSAGRHEVVLRFRSRPFQLGLTISLMTLATPALVFLYRRRKR